MAHPQVYPDMYEDCRLLVVVPRSWKWSSLPDHYQRLPPISASDVETFQGLLESCWKCACEDVSEWVLRVCCVCCVMCVDVCCVLCVACCCVVCVVCRMLCVVCVVCVVYCVYCMLDVLDVYV